MKAKKTPTPQRVGTAEKEEKALRVARKALDELSDDPEAMRLFIVMVPLLGGTRLKNF